MREQVGWVPLTLTALPASLTLAAARLWRNVVGRWGRFIIRAVVAPALTTSLAVTRTVGLGRGLSRAVLRWRAFSWCVRLFLVLPWRAVRRGTFAGRFGGWLTTATLTIPCAGFTTTWMVVRRSIASRAARARLFRFCFTGRWRFSRALHVIRGAGAD